MVRTIYGLVLLSLACVGLAGCGPADAGAKQARYPLRVVCTTAQVGDMVRNIGGSHVLVEVLMGPGVDPHLFEAALDTLPTLESADAVFYSGLHLEGRLAEALEHLRDETTVAVTEELEKNRSPRLRQPPEYHGTYDPHVWFDASLWAECARYAAQRLGEMDPAHANDFRDLGDRYVKSLLELHEETRQRMAEIPKQQRVLVTAHDAFGYFGQAYDVEVHGLQGISTSDEADIQGIQRLVDLLVSRNVKAVFIESSIAPKNIETLIENCASRGHQVKLGGELFSDALGDPKTELGTYVGMMKYNVNTMVEALR